MDKLHEENRKQFEKWWHEEYCHLEGSDAAVFVKYAAWQAWKQSRASIVVELPEQKEDRARNCSSDDIAYGFNQGVGACRNSILSIGLSIKGE